MKQQTLTVGHVRIDFQLPSLLTQSLRDTSGERRHEAALKPLKASIHEGFKACLALFVARSLVGSGITTEAKHPFFRDEAISSEKRWMSFQAFEREVQLLDGIGHFALLKIIVMKKP